MIILMPLFSRIKLVLSFAFRTILRIYSYILIHIFIYEYKIFLTLLAENSS